MAKNIFKIPIVIFLTFPALKVVNQTTNFYGIFFSKKVDKILLESTNLRHILMKF